jgi:hypothetical protein
MDNEKLFSPTSWFDWDLRREWAMSQINGTWCACLERWPATKNLSVSEIIQLVQLVLNETRLAPPDACVGDRGLPEHILRMPPNVR